MTQIALSGNSIWNQTTARSRHTMVGTCLVAATLCSLSLVASGQAYDIVFSSNRAGNHDIWRMHEDGTGLQQLTCNAADEGSAQPSRNGQLIAYQRFESGVFQVRLMNADGSNDRLLKGYTSGSGAYPVAWFPEGNALLIIANPGPGQTLDRLGLDGKQTAFLAASTVGQGSMNMARFAPDGQKLCFSAQEGNWSPTMEIYTADYAAGAVVTSSIQKITTNSQHDDWMAFSPDGTKLAFSKGVNGSGYEPPSDLHTMGIDGMGTATQIDGSFYTAFCSDWAPKNRILFDGQPTSADPNNIYSMNPDGTGVTKLTSGNFNEGGGKYISRISPEIEIQQPLGSSLRDGKTKKSFGTVTVGKTGVAKTFTIKNTGGAQLTGLGIVKNGVNAANFTVTGPANTSLAPGASTTFKVNFKPTAKGVRNAAIHIRSNDANENPFDINLTGLGVAR